MSATVVAPTYVHQAYPKMLYRVGHAPIVVKDQAAHLALEPGWGEVPASAVPVPGQPVTGPVAVPSSTAVDLELATLRAENARLKLLQQAPPPSQPVAPAPAVEKPLIFAPGPDGRTPEQQIEADIAAERAELYATSVSAIISRLKGSSLATLQKLQTYEQANPRPEGPRKSLMDAVAIAIKGLI
jgi:hypothetical protein